MAGRGIRRWVQLMLVAAVAAATTVVGAPAAPAARAQTFPPPTVILFSPADHVAVGGTVTVDAGWEPFGTPTPIPGFRVGLSVPPQFRIDSVLPSSCAIADSGVACLGTSVRVQLTALEAGNDLVFSAAASIDEAGGSTGQAVYDIIDPSIGAELHPDLTGPDLGQVGSPFSFHGPVVNAGGTAMDDVVATIDPGPGLDLTAATWTPSPGLGAAPQPCTVAAGVATCAIGTMAPYSDVALDVSVTPVAAAAASVTTVTVTSSTPQDDPDPRADSQDLTVTLVAEDTADLGVELVTAVSQPTVGVRFTVDIVVTNHGPTPLAAASVTLTFGDYERFRSPSGCTATDGTLSDCPTGPLAVGGSQTLQLTLIPRTNDAGTITASVTSSIPDPTPDAHANTDTLDLPGALAPNVDLAGSLTSTDTAFPDEPYDLVFSFATNGPSIAPDVTAWVLVPPSWTVDSVTTFSGTCGAPAPTIYGTFVSCTYGTWSPGRNTTVSIKATPSTAGPAQIRVAATSSLPDPDGTLVLTHDVEVHPQLADLQANTGTGTTGGGAYLGGPLDHSFRFRNLGPSDAHDVELRVTVPADVDVTFRGASSLAACTFTAPTIVCHWDRVVAGGIQFAFVTLTHNTLTSPADYFISVSSSTPEPSPDPNPDTAMHRFTVHPSLTNLVSGRVLGPGDVAGTVVLAYDLDDVFAPTASALVGADGRYRLNLPGGWYRLFFQPPVASGLAATWSGGSLTRADAEPVAVSGNGFQEVTVPAETLEAAGTITGEVVDGAGNGVAGVEVTVFERDEPLFPSRIVTTGPDGTYTAAGLRATDYVVRFRPPGGPVRWFDGIVHLTAGGTTTGVDATVG